MSGLSTSKLLTKPLLSRAEMKLYINTCKEVDKLLTSSFAGHVPFNWDWVLNYFTVVSMIDDRLQSSNIATLNTAEQGLYKITLEYGRSLNGCNRSYYGGLINLQDIYFKTEDLIDCFKTHCQSEDLRFMRGKEVNLKQLLKISCFDYIINLYRYFQSWLKNKNSQLLIALVKLQEV